MDRRDFLRALPAAFLLSSGCTTARPPAAGTMGPVLPGEGGWPTLAEWERLRVAVGGRLLQLEAADGTAVTSGAQASRNPYQIRDSPVLTQTVGYLDAWRSSPSAYAVAAETPADVAAAVGFAARHRLRLVVKGAGHSYQGTSNAPRSLLIWTRAMTEIAIHDHFVPEGCSGLIPPAPAVSIGAGAVWMEVYRAVTVDRSRYVQGGGCATVGVAGLIQSGGFGSFSKRFGLAAAGLLEAEVVTADGEVRIANQRLHPDLFWALKGGGGGSFGVLTRVTLRTRDLPTTFGGVLGSVRADSESAYRQLIDRVIDLYADRLFNPHWGEQLRFGPGMTLRIQMVFQGLDRQAALETWEPFSRYVESTPGLQWTEPLIALDVPARHFWDPDFLREHAPSLVVSDDRPDAPRGNVFWSGDEPEAGQFLHAYRSAWLPAALLESGPRSRLTEALFRASRQWTVALHFNKGLAGAPPEEVRAARDAAINPAAASSFALAIVASGGRTASGGMPENGAELEDARRSAGRVHAAMLELQELAGDTGAYLAEADYFQADWQRDFWGANYARLLAVKRKYDPERLFLVHHGVGSE